MGETQDGNGKIVLPFKWRDEEGELDLSNPTDLEKAKRLVNQGYGYEKGQQELKAVKGELDKTKSDLNYWSSLVDDARESGDTSRIQSALETVGVKFSKKQSDDDEFILDEGDKKYDALSEKIDRLEGALYDKYTKDIHSQLEAKYKEEKFPEYNAKEIEDFANKKGIRDFDDAYKIMHFDELNKLETKEKEDKSKKHQDKVKKAASKEPGSAGLPAKPPTVHKDYKKSSAEWVDDPAVAENLFTDD